VELADTSAWTNRRKDPAVSRDFETRLLAGKIATCAMVELELLWEAQDAPRFHARRERFEALKRASMGDRVWRRATDVFERLAEAGSLHHRSVAIPDLLIAAAAEIAEIPLCHYDRDFDVIATITGQPMRAIAPLGLL